MTDTKRSLPTRPARTWLGGDKPHVLLAFSHDRGPTGPFVEALLKTLQCPWLRITPFQIPGAVIHLQRDQMVKAALADKTVDFLCMVDSDQLFHQLVLPRLVFWDIPIVAPVIVQRLGDPLPVAYRLSGDDAGGRYDSQVGAILAYLSQFRTERWAVTGGSAVLPVTPDAPATTYALPDEIEASLSTPLWPVDALGAGMLVIRRDVLESIEPSPHTGMYFDFQRGQGEDFNFCERVREAGWGGATPGPRGGGLFVDRGCLVGHLVWYGRGAAELATWADQRARTIEQEAARERLLPSASELLEDLEHTANERGQHAWKAALLPHERPEAVAAA